MRGIRTGQVLLDKYTVTPPPFSSRPSYPSSLYFPLKRVQSLRLLRDGALPVNTRNNKANYMRSPDYSFATGAMGDRPHWARWSRRQELLGHRRRRSWRPGGGDFCWEHREKEGGHRFGEEELLLDGEDRVWDADGGDGVGDVSLVSAKEEAWWVA